MTGRYQIGTIDKWGNFQGDTLGNDPDLTTFATLEGAVKEIRSLHYESIDDVQPLTNAAVLDASDMRIVWRQE